MSVERYCSAAYVVQMCNLADLSCRRQTFNHLTSWLTDARNLTNPNTGAYCCGVGVAGGGMLPLDIRLRVLCAAMMFGGSWGIEIRGFCLMFDVHAGEAYCEEKEEIMVMKEVMKKR